MRNKAREYLALAAKLENEASAANGAAESAASMPAALTAPLPSLERPRELADPTVRLDLRAVGPAEAQ